MHCRLAALSTGGVVKRTARTPSPAGPTDTFEALGWTLTRRRMAPSGVSWRNEGETSARNISVVRAVFALEEHGEGSLGTRRPHRLFGFQRRRTTRLIHFHFPGIPRGWIFGGAGAGPDGAGAHGIHTHMTNTQNTPVEELERLFPVRITTYALRPRPKTPRDRFPGGRGVIRHYRFLTPCEVSVVSERRHHPPYGLLGGSPGLCGRNTLRSPDGSAVLLKGKARLLVQPGDTLCVETPGGGNFGELPP